MSLEPPLQWSWSVNLYLLYLYLLTGVCILTGVYVCFREMGQERDGAVSPGSEQDQTREDTQRMSSKLPTMWLGAQNGW